MLCVVHEFGDAAGCTVHTMGSYVIVADSVKNCVAKDCGSVGIVGDQVADIRGESTGSYGINTNYTAQNCYGSSSGTSLIATSANNCYGSGITYGLYAFYTAAATRATVTPARVYMRSLPMACVVFYSCPTWWQGQNQQANFFIP